MSHEDEAVLQQEHHEGVVKKPKHGTANPRNGKQWWQRMSSEELYKHATSMDTQELHTLSRELKDTAKAIQQDIESHTKEDDESWWWRAHDARGHVAAKAKIVRQELWQRQRVDFSLRKSRKTLRWAINQAIRKIGDRQPEIAESILRDALIRTQQLEKGSGVNIEDDE